MAPANDRKKQWNDKNKEKVKISAKKSSKIYRESKKNDELFKLKEKTRQKAYYERKKALKVDKSIDKGYKLRNTMLKKLKQVKSILPSSKSKRKELYGELVKEFPEWPQHPTKSSRLRELSDSSKLAVDFLERAENVVILPGKNDTMIVKGTDGEKIRLQKRVFMYSIKELFCKFKKEFSSLKLGRTRFFQLAKKTLILPFSKMPIYSCMCKIHENFKLAFKGFKMKLNDPKIITYRDFHEVC